MKPEAQKYLFDIWRAVKLLTDFTAGKSFADFEQYAMLRSTVGRQCKVVNDTRPSNLRDSEFSRLIFLA